MYVKHIRSICTILSSSRFVNNLLQSDPNFMGLKRSETAEEEKRVTWLPVHCCRPMSIEIQYVSARSRILGSLSQSETSTEELHKNTIWHYYQIIAREWSEQDNESISVPPEDSGGRWRPKILLRWCSSSCSWSSSSWRWTGKNTTFQTAAIRHRTGGSRALQEETENFQKMLIQQENQTFTLMIWIPWNILKHQIPQQT